jgi:hypothetical protein
VRIESSVASRQSPAFVAAVLGCGLFFATPAVACKIQFGIGQNNKSITNIEKRLAAGQRITKPQREKYAAFKRDSAAYEAVHNKLWPVCSENGGTSCFPNCAELSAKELAAAPFVADGIHYRVSPQEAKELEKTKQNLINKWKH